MQKQKPFITVLTLITVLFSVVDPKIPTTLEGPFKPVTVPFDVSLRGHAVDLPDTDPRVQRRVKGYEPEQISVSLSSSYDSVWISWITGEYQIGFNITPLNPETVSSVVRYGTIEHVLSHEAKGCSLVYNQLYPFEGLQNYTSGIIHHVRLTGLKPSTVYYYRCGDPSLQAMSGIFHFKTMPISGPQSYPKRIAIVGDLGLTYNTTATIDHVISNKPDLMLLIGDVTYANLYLTNGTGADCYSCTFSDTPIHETYQPRWDYWGRFMQDLVSKVPIMVVEGNHEIELQAENQSFVAYSSRFAFPSKESGSSSTMYYSFNAGGIHFIMLGAYIGYNKTVYNYTLDPCGPVHITVGDGGNREKMAIPHADEPGECPEPLSTPDSHMPGFCARNFTSGPAAGKFCWDWQPEYSALRESSFGHGILEVKNETWALWTWHKNQDPYKEIGDQIYIVRTPESCPVHPKVTKLWSATR
ncbi:Purple acid phosphatase, N-terminal [Dillenia turbinata]|uniref:Purple acid phosphatase n=1 Tax=Dillenia turbinata TaxID=194707 RepID=A0AAN8W347_9MAGN